VLREALRAAATYGNLKSGWVIVADATTGAPRASRGFTAPAKRGDDLHWKDEEWILAQRFTPASLMKPLVAAVLLERGVATLDDPLPCEGASYVIGSNRYREWKKGGFSRLSLRQAVVQSSNVCLLEAASRLSPASLRRGLADLGITRLAERSEEVPDELARLAMGLGIELSPREFLAAYSRLAYPAARPGEASAPRADVSAAFRAMLRDCVKEGTCRNAETPMVEVGGKTGTALARGNQEPSLTENPRTIASFIGMVPAQSPEAIVLVVLTQEDDRAWAGGKLAAPAFRRIAESLATTP
jgi:cell division protein FtsI/penicillin-binding protein 2